MKTTPQYARLSKTLRRIEQENRTKLEASFKAGQYVTEYATDFWDRNDDGFLGNGKRQVFGAGLVCKPVQLSKASLLVSLNYGGSVWYSWIHP